MPEEIDRRPGGWNGRSYYGKPQLKPAPFNSALVGTYVFLAGLSGGAQLLATILDLTRDPVAAPAVRRGRLLSLLAPTIGAVCLIGDLHTPKRFYNMLRVVKSTSPMSIGGWTLVGFSGLSALTAGLQFVANRVRVLSWLGRLARVTEVPAALAGVGMCTYTASLLSATSTPLWSVTPVSLAIRFAAASVASAAAALELGEGRSHIGRRLDTIAVAALATELAAMIAAEERLAQIGIDAHEGGTANATVGTSIPLGLLAASLLLTSRRSKILTTAASAAMLAGSWAMRICVIRDGAESARRPEVSLRVAQPDNLPDRG